MSIPYIEVSGTNKQIGEAIGEHLRDDIEVALTRFEKHYKPTPKLKARRTKLLVTAKKYFPEYIDELQGIADGAEQKIDRLISFSFEEELAYFESCSTFAVTTGHTILFGHNEDWDHPMPLYVVKAKPKKGPAFLSLSYAAQLPGTSATINEAGLVYSSNSIATDLVEGGLPKIYCLRSMASASSLDALVNRIAQTDRCSGNNSVIIYKKGMFTLEWSPTKLAVETCESWIAHANKFILPEMKDACHPPGRGSTSVGRLQQMWNGLIGGSIVNAQGMKKLLASHEDKPLSLCRHAKDDHTIASIVIDTASRRMEVVYGNPCTAPFQSFWL